MTAIYFLLMEVLTLGQKTPALLNEFLNASDLHFDYCLELLDNQTQLQSHKKLQTKNLISQFYFA